MTKHLVLYLLIIVILVSCTHERQACLTPKIASFKIECVHEPTDTSTIPIDTALPNAVFGCFTSNGLVSSIYSQQSIFTLSLSSVSDTCKWLFTTDSLKHSFDTLVFYYQRQLQFLSNACGYAYFYSMDSMHTTHNNIDSEFIITKSVTNDVKPTHIHIYIHPSF